MRPVADQDWKDYRYFIHISPVRKFNDRDYNHKAYDRHYEPASESISELNVRWIDHAAFFTRFPFLEYQTASRAHVFRSGYSNGSI